MEGIKNHSRKEHKKYQPSWSVMNESQPLFEFKVKIDIRLYHDNIDALEINH